MHFWREYFIISAFCACVSAACNKMKLQFSCASIFIRRRLRYGSCNLMVGFSCSQRPWHFFNAVRLKPVSVDMVERREFALLPRNVISSVYPRDSLTAFKNIFISFDDRLNYFFTNINRYHSLNVRNKNTDRRRQVFIHSFACLAFGCCLSSR